NPSQETAVTAALPCPPASAWRGSRPRRARPPAPPPPPGPAAAGRRAPRARSAGISRGSTGARAAPASHAASPACRPTSAAPPAPASAPAPSPSHSPNYNLLEETSQVRETAHRLLGGFGRNYGCSFEGRHGAQLPPWLSFLRKAAERRGVRLAFQPRSEMLYILLELLLCLCIQ
uniref:Uncharacterized protein n=1 Tax=Aegilops tauschii subsp. strangulata TaxID=200361 RepID=A0A453QID1_AEGTS